MAFGSSWRMRPVAPYLRCKGMKRCVVMPTACMHFSGTDGAVFDAYRELIEERVRRTTLF
jgi:hypothetical protein